MDNRDRGYKVSENVKRILSLIKNKDYSKKELHTFYENINNEYKKEKITEFEFEILIQELEHRVRITQPRLSKILFGPKDEKVRISLREFLEELKVTFDFSNNFVGSHVKTGGSMINGTKYIDVYISYKNKDKWHCSFAYVQDDANSNLYIMIRKYQGGLMNKESVSQSNYEIEDIEKAKMVFIEHLEEIID
tara:strand:- start:314 stop:889 length:576 start_codon:yes stop_codon:yes gene_type:complete